MVTRSKVLSMRSAAAVPELQHLSSSESDLLRIADLVTRLLGHFWTAADDEDSRQAQIEDWLADLREFGPQIVAEACTRWRRANPDKRPGPGHIRAFCLEEMRDQRLALPAPDPWPHWLAEEWGPAPEGPIKRRKAMELYAQRAARWPTDPVPEIEGFKSAGARAPTPIPPGEAKHLMAQLSRKCG